MLTRCHLRDQGVPSLLGVVIESLGEEVTQPWRERGLGDPQSDHGLRPSPERFDPGVVLRSVLGVADSRTVLQQDRPDLAAAGIHTVLVVLDDPFAQIQIEGPHPLANVIPPTESKIAVSAQANAPTWH